MAGSFSKGFVFAQSWAPRAGALSALLPALVLPAGCRSQAPAPQAQNPAPVLEHGVSAGGGGEHAARPVPPAADAGSVTPKPAKDVAKHASELAKNAEDAPSKKTEHLEDAHPVKSPPTQADQGKHKVLLLGDSLAATGFGVLLEKALDAHPNIDCARRAKSATGLARPDYFDWYTQGKKAAKKHDPELIIVILGGNDGQDLVLGPNRKKRSRWKKDEWDQAYTQRTLEFIDGMKAPGRKLIWLGLPRTDTKGFEKKLTRIRAAQKSALAQRSSWASYLSTTPMVEDGQGKLKKKVRHGRRLAALRQKDGIHFTMHGSHYFADQVYPVIVNALGLKVVQSQ